jgi:glycerol uptake facilitator-like aquaporin
MNPSVTIGVYVREGRQENRHIAFKIIVAQFLGGVFGVIVAMNNLASSSERWRRVHPNSKVPVEWMPTVCPVDPLTGQCTAHDRGYQVFVTIILASFLFIFVVLLIKTPGYSPSNIPFVNYAIAACGLYAFVGCSHLLGGGINPAVSIAVIWAHDLQVLES